MTDDRSDWVWVEEAHGLSWRLLPDGTDKRCRWGAAPNHPACGAPAVAELNRGRQLGWRRVESWWAYCEPHMYGRRIEDGRILIRVPPDTPAARR